MKVKITYSQFSEESIYETVKKVTIGRDHTLILEFEKGAKFGLESDHYNTIEIIDTEEIKHLRAEIDNLNKDLTDTIALNYSEQKELKAEIEKQKETVAELAETLSATIAGQETLQQYIETAKTEAIKEFAEKLKEQIYIKKDRLFYAEKIDNLVKEMVGED